jgi:hypothetical protein
MEKKSATLSVKTVFNEICMPTMYLSADTPVHSGCKKYNRQLYELLKKVN